MAKIQTKLFEEACAISWKQTPAFDLDAELFRILSLAKSACTQPIFSAQESVAPVLEPLQTA
jgi:hypothetical protein